MGRKTRTCSQFIMLFTKEAFPFPFVRKLLFLRNGWIFIEYFTTIDWCVVDMLSASDHLGGASVARQAIKYEGLFLVEGPSLWPAVSGSIIATEISGVTFIGVPGSVFAAQGNFTYLQWGIGSIIARIVGYFFVRAFCEPPKSIVLMTTWATVSGRGSNGSRPLYFRSVASGQSVRVLGRRTRPQSRDSAGFEYCIIIIGIFAIGWTLMGGMRTVIWTGRNAKFFLFIGAALLSIIWMVGGIEGGWFSMVEISAEFGKFNLNFSK